MSGKIKTVLICGGGDWFDASADLLDIPEETPIDTLHAQYSKWREEARMNRNEYKTFVEWLKEFHSATDSKCEQFWEP